MKDYTKMTTEELVKEAKRLWSKYQTASHNVPEIAKEYEACRTELKNRQAK